MRARYHAPRVRYDDVEPGHVGDEVAAVERARRVLDVVVRGDR
jgi:hypothetical protein